MSQFPRSRALLRSTRILCACALLVGALTAQAAAPEAAPRLVLQITVDQLRGDLLPRYRSRFGQGGFRRLLEQGVWYSNAYYETANTVTCAGHAVLVTGADVAQHGIVGNNWFEREDNKNVYCVEDSRYPPVGESARPGAGMSPARLTSSTVGDEIVIASGHRSRAFAVSGKDRSAIVPGGHLGKAFWLGNTSGAMVTSRYYYDALPTWVAAWNDRKLFLRYKETGWKPMYPVETYINARSAANPFAHPKGDSGRSFPHVYTDFPENKLMAALRFSPAQDELTADFVRELITQEKLGRNGVTDYLSISFSATDYVGHSYGPNSVESEDNLLRLDVTLAELFAFIDKTLGLRNTIVVLSADHGADDIPEERKEEGYDADRFGGEALHAALNAGLRERFNVDGLVLDVVPPGVYLDRAKLAASHLDFGAVESALAEVAQRQPGVAMAYKRSDLLAGRIGHTAVLDRMQRAFHPTRSGDVIVIQKPYWYFDEDPNFYAAMHGSPYSYDTFVPILMLVPGVKPAIVSDPAAPGQIAPTLANLLHIRPPSGCACDPPLPRVISRMRAE